MESQKGQAKVTLTTETVDGTVVVRVSGEVDMSNTSSIEETVGVAVPNNAHAMVLDLTGVTYLDSAGIRLLYHLESRLATHQQRLVVVVPPGSVLMRTLRAAGVIGTLVLASSVDAAIDAARSVVERGDARPDGRTG